jgi:hypothetical protein
VSDRARPALEAALLCLGHVFGHVVSLAEIEPVL